MIVEITGDEEKINGFIEVMRPQGIIELVRTGSVAMGRGANSLLAGIAGYASMYAVSYFLDYPIWAVNRPYLGKQDPGLANSAKTLHPYYNRRSTYHLNERGGQDPLLFEINTAALIFGGCRMAKFVFGNTEERSGHS